MVAGRQAETAQVGKEADMAPRPIPEGYHTATPYLIIKGAAAALEYYKKAFGAREIMRFATPGGMIGHAEIKIGDSTIMLADEHPDMGYRSPKSLGGSPVSILLYVEDVDRWFERAIAAGGKVERPLANQFYGDRTGVLVDPFGHVWSIATHVEDVSAEEMDRRVKAKMG
jgi:PhnB protein